ncbi:MAG: hypothetical protein JNK04_17920, partial [Myxococcales bacterium]|nr:hypothetical protein [Myxococcales bacterium]
MGIGDWFRKTFGKDDGDGKSAPESGKWLEPGADGNPFDVRLLDLMANLGVTATTTDPAIAARSVSWRLGGQRDIDVHVEGTTHGCDLRYPAPRELPEGMLYRPRQMEDKWVIVYRDGRMAAARSWTGETKAVARARHDGDELVLSEVTFADNAGFDVYGDPVAAFDWLIRAHALGARIPFPASADGIAILAAVPLSGFPMYGRQLFCAAVDYELGPAR